MDTTREQFTAINRRIFNLRDGEVLQIQKEYGATYKKSMGVAIISLENIAKDYAPSHDLAKLFWEFNGREQTLMAGMLEEPEKVNIQELESYLLKTHTPEFWEQLTKMLIRKLPNLANLISLWLESQNEILCTYAILALGYCPDVFSVTILEKILALEITKDSYLDKCIYRVLLKVGIRNDVNFETLASNKSFQEKYVNLYEELKDFY